MADATEHDKLCPVGEAERLRVIVTAIDAHPTPTDAQGNCWYCGGGLGHGPHGHLTTCPLAMARAAVTAVQPSACGGQGR